MKKRIKIFIIALILLIGLGVAASVLYFVTKPKYSELICISTRYEPETYELEEIVTAKFDGNSKFVSLEKIEKYEIENENFKDNYIKNLKEYYKDDFDKKVKVENDVLIIYSDVIESTNINKTDKKEFGEKYEELGYKCK